MSYTATTRMLICASVWTVTYVGLIWFGALLSATKVRTLGKFPLHNRKTGPILSLDLFNWVSFLYIIVRQAQYFPMIYLIG